MKLRVRQPGRQGILPFVLELGDREDVTANTGLPLVVETMRALGLDEVVRQRLDLGKRRSEFPPERKLESLVALLASGGDRLEDIRILSQDKGLERLLGGPFPSPDALGDFLALFHDPNCCDDRPVGKKAFVPLESSALQGLEAVNCAIVQRGTDRQSTTATIDHDGTIIEAHKRDATVAYEGTRGYQPLTAVWAEEQLLVADEFRDGNVAGGEDPLSSVKRAFANLPSWVTQRYFRADSAAYHAALLRFLEQEGIGFTISADMTRELRACCVALTDDQWVELETREREQVCVGEVEFAPGDWPKSARPLRYVALRFTPVQNELFEQRGPKYLAVVTNRRDLSAADLVRWHWQKAGTIEHVHRVMKDELGAAVMPSARFGANAAWYRINAITYNVLTVLKRRALPERFRFARPKRLRFEVFSIPGKLVTHQSQLSVRPSAGKERLAELVTARQRLLEMLEST